MCTHTHFGDGEWLAEVLSSNKSKAPRCGSIQRNSERHIHSRCVCVECDGVFSSKSFWAEGRPLLQSEGYLSLSIFLPHFLFFNNALPYLSVYSSVFPSHLPLLSSTKFLIYFLHFCATLSIAIYILICLITTNLNHINSISEQYINVR